MKQQWKYFVAATALLGAVACSKDEKVAPVKPSVGISFQATSQNVDLNTNDLSFNIVVPVVADMTKAELEARFKLKLVDSASNSVDTTLTLNSTTVTENPLTVTVNVTAKQSLAVIKRTVFARFDESMQPMTIGTNSEMAIRIAPFAPAATWFKNEPYYAPNTYYFNTSTQKYATLAGHYSVLDSTDATVIGFVNNYVAESGVAFFNMVRIYTEEMGGGSVSAKTARINVPKALRLIPSSAGARSGVVEVIKQDVVVTRKDGTTFKIGISGSGTFSLDTKLIELTMNFDDTAIGGAAVNKYDYKISVDKIQ
ncbi:hypothetical protein LX64_02343 [Chitinophaga skermanii]|uniref:Uncharacterized protein n=1 Tax=Chitinophaga skermanii TaxID=331697 RepID=A0A327QKX7_9BACT|nr:hypothetical protein [Chitinophaga skermanii]RAJ05189.1 hypothetical protein LX64_02343 [Chitinophaga skermanii]